MLRPAFWAGLIMACALLVACESAATKGYTASLDRVPQASTIRTIAQGEVIGTFGAADTMAWYGIPFAAPPVGELRWRAPRPAEAWAGRYEATKPDRECVQYSNLFGSADADWTLTGSEDCLYLNVWAPSDAGDRPLPVMVWIHGGANIGGSAGMYEMGHLAAQGDVIVVAINYRLAMLGWFAHPSLVATAETDLDRSMNFALLDQIAALEWVQENISAFGGDAENVTVFGQSAGAFNIAALMSSPLSDGLFHKAIMQSGGFQSAAYEDAVSGSASNLANSVSANSFIEAMVEAGALPPQNEVTPETLAEHLRALPLKDIFDTYQSFPAAMDMPGLISPVDTANDGIVVPEMGIQAALRETGGLRDIPLLIGTNRNELRGLGFADKEMMRSLFNLAFWPRDKGVYAAFGDYPDTVWAYHGVRAPAEAWAAVRTAPVYTYRFDWDEQGKKLLTDISFLVGASHSLEMPFIINGFDQKETDPAGIFFSKKNKASRETLSAQMIEYWSAFAHHGAPGRGLSGTLPRWTAWAESPVEQSLMLLDGEKDGGVRMGPATPTPDTLFESFLSDPRMKTDHQRCKTANMVIDMVSRVGGTLDDWREFVEESCEQ